MLWICKSPSHSFQPPVDLTLQGGKALTKAKVQERHSTAESESAYLVQISARRHVRPEGRNLA